MENQTGIHLPQNPVSQADLAAALNGIPNPKNAHRRLRFLRALSQCDRWFTHATLAQEIGLLPVQVPFEFGWLTRILRLANDGTFSWREYMEVNHAGHYRLPANFRVIIAAFLAAL